MFFPIGLGIAANGQWRPWEWQFIVTMAGCTALAALSVILLRPLPADVPPPDKELVKLLGEVYARDIAFLEVADTTTQYPKPISDKATELVPNGEIWRSESVARATERARRLIAHGLLEWRGSEVQTTTLGQKLIKYDREIRDRKGCTV